MDRYVKENNMIYEAKRVGNSIIKTSKAIRNIQLAYANGTITANCIENTIVNDEIVEVPFETLVKFEFDGEVIEAQSSNGIVTIDFLSEVPGNYKVKTVNEGIGNGGVIINV